MIFRKTTLAALPTTLLILTVFSTPAVSNIQVAFSESAPKDRFSFSNVGKCRISDLMIAIDLSASTGNLIFDTSATGAGVEVFQPFEALSGNISLVSGADVTDGENKLTISVDSINAGETVSFTIDVDDTLTQSELGMIRVTGSEIQGGQVAVSIRGETPTPAVFGSDSTALIKLSNCDE